MASSKTSDNFIFNMVAALQGRGIFATTEHLKAINRTCPTGI